MTDPAARRRAIGTSLAVGRSAGRARQVGDTGPSSEIEKLRRPTMSPWLVNRLVRKFGRPRRPTMSPWLVNQPTREDSSQMDELLTLGESPRDGVPGVPSAWDENR